MVLAPRNKQVETCQIRRQTAMIVVHEPIFFEVDSSSSYARQQKSDNLQYNMLGHWVDETIVSLTKL